MSDVMKPSLGGAVKNKKNTYIFSLQIFVFYLKCIKTRKLIAPSDPRQVIYFLTWNCIKKNPQIH